MVVILLGSGFEEAEALVPADLLRRAGVEVRFAGVDGLSVTGGQGITVQADCSVEQIRPEEVELLFLPGGLGGVAAIKASQAARRLILACHGRGARIAAICAAPTILGELGLLKGRRAVCYPGLESGLTGAQPCPGQSVVTDGELITGQAAGAAFPFGLALVAALCGADKAEKLARSVCWRG